MSAWGVEPFENDTAADWFGMLWDEFPVPTIVEQTLNLELRGNHEEIRAAAYFLLQLGETYIWPVDSIDLHCDLAARRLEDIMAMEIYSAAAFQEKLREEIDELRSRISPDFQRPNG